MREVFLNFGLQAVEENLVVSPCAVILCLGPGIHTCAPVSGIISSCVLLFSIFWVFSVNLFLSTFPVVSPRLIGRAEVLCPPERLSNMNGAVVHTANCPSIHFNKSMENGQNFALTISVSLVHVHKSAGKLLSSWRLAVFGALIQMNGAAIRHMHCQSIHFASLSGVHGTPILAI